MNKPATIPNRNKGSEFNRLLAVENASPGMITWEVTKPENEPATNVIKPITPAILAYIWGDDSMDFDPLLLRFMLKLLNVSIPLLSFTPFEERHCTTVCYRLMNDTACV